MLRYLRQIVACCLLVAPLNLGCAEQATVSPEGVVSAFFGAVDRDDCKGALRWLDGPAKERFEEEDCDAALQALRQKRFERVLSAHVDGRDARMHLVRARFAGEREPVLLGVRKTRRGHRIVSF
ncbi:MAG: hypothetical protein WBN30_00035 [Polyangiales bacterium]